MLQNINHFDTSVETNTLAATVFFVAAIVSDAFTATDPAAPYEAPTALRTTAVVLVACLASPPIREWMIFQQRIVAAVLLGIVAFVGWHEAGAGTRLADAFYTSVTLGACTFAFWSNGVENAGVSAAKTRSAEAMPFLRREALANLATSCLFYASLRMLRIGIGIPDSARFYTVTNVMFDGTLQETPGYAHSSAVATVAQCIGAATGVATAVALLVNEKMRLEGTAAATSLLCVSAFAQLTAAFVSSMAFSENLETLVGIWSAGACSSLELCRPAWEARRFASVVSMGASLWITGLGTLILAFAPKLRLKTRAQASNVRTEFETAAYAAAALLVCTATLFAYLSFTGSEALTDYAAVGALIAVGLGGFVDSVSGAALFAVCVGADIVQMLFSHGFFAVFGHFTHCSNATMVVLLLLYAAIVGLVEILWKWIPPRFVDSLDATAGLVATLGTSIAVLLFMATTALQLSFDGQLIADSQYRAADNRFARTMAAGVMEHWMPLLIWLPIYSCRCEVEQLRWRTRLVAYYVAPVVPLVLWTIVVNANDASFGHTLSWQESSAFLAAVALVGVVPWVVFVWA